MSLYRCTCKAWYTHAKEIDELLNQISDQQPVKSAVSICPICGQKSIIGGEHDLDYDTGEPCIMMFGLAYDEQRHKDYPAYTAIELVETDQTDTGFATWADGKTLHLTPKTGE